MKRIISITVSLMLCIGLLAGCAQGAAESGVSSDASQSTSDASSTPDASSMVDPTAGIDFSFGLEENGYFSDIKALDYVTLPEDYASLSLPDDVANLDSEIVQSNVDSILAGYATAEQILDREVEDGDTVNIDYVGSVDGVEFSGGSTGGMGTSVLAGSENYIDDFLTQIIGHTPGETIDVVVTFPDPYSNDESLSGKEALFVTTINYIEGEPITPELNDEFVADNLTAQYGWITVEEMETGISTSLLTSQINEYIWSYVPENATFEEVPESVMEQAKQEALASLTMQAAMYGMNIEDLLTANGLESEDAYLETNLAQIEDTAKVRLLVQAIAEDAKLEVTEESIIKVIGSDENLAEYEERYGKAYLAYVSLYDIVDTFLKDNATAA